MYVVVLLAATLVALVGLSGLLLLRVQMHTAEDGTGAYEARLAAQGGVEYALCFINNNADWRDRVAGELDAAQLQIGRAQVTLAIEDTADGNFSNNPSDGVSISASATVDGLTQGYRVYAAPSHPLDCLQSAIHSGSWQWHEGTLTGAGGISCNNVIGVDSDGYLDVGDLCASGYTIFGTVIGQRNICPAKTMPDDALFDYYRANAVEIPLAAIPSKNIKDVVLGPGLNPYGASSHPNGLYYINIGSNNLDVEMCRIEGTLLIDATSGSDVHIKKQVVWQPATSTYPALLINGAKRLHIDVKEDLREADQGVNFNPIGLPLDGVENSTTDDVFPSRLYGLVYTTCPIRIEDLWDARGAIVCAASLEAEEKTVHIEHDPGLLESPPIGFHDHTVTISPGSWERLTP